MNIFGPIPSRRLGRSLGINNIPAKNCTYSCVYCQIGRMGSMMSDRKYFYDPDELISELKNKLKQLDEKIDYLTVVADGEPTLDSSLDKLVEKLKAFGIKTAIITNSSLITNKNIRDILLKFDLVSLKTDALIEDIWRKTDRPHGKLNLEEIKEGIVEFSRKFNNKLITETMLIRDLNDSAENIEAIANFIVKINPEISYISIPTRPPAEDWVKPATEQRINEAFSIFQSHRIKTELLIGYEGNEFSSTGNIREDLLSITSVHPMKEEAIMEYLRKSREDFSAVQQLIDEGQLVETPYRHEKYFIRKFKNN